MAISATTMKCPVCEDRLLDALTTPFGTWDRCSNCRGIFIHDDLVVSASQDRARCEEALGEMQGLLLPTERTCPKCLQKLFDGRVQSRGVIFSLCTTCQSMWTTLPTLSQFEEAIEKKISFETEAVLAANPEYSQAGVSAASKFYEDSGFARLFRGFARLFDRAADSFRTDKEEEELLKEAKRLKKEKGKKAAPPEKLIQKVEPPPPAPMKKKAEPVKPPEPIKAPEPVAEPEAPKIEVPEFIFPEEKKPEPAPEPKTVEPPKPVESPKPVEVPQGSSIFVTKPEEAPKSASVPAPVSKKPVVIGGGPAPKPGFFAKLKAAWAAKPKKTVPPVAKAPVAKPVEAPKPKPIEPPKPIAKVEPSKPSKPGFFASMKAAWAPRPKKSAPPVVKAPAPKPKKEKVPSDPFDHVAFWPPWILFVAGMMLSGLRDYGFEAGPAVLWGIMGGSAGLMVRLKRIYPSKNFQETTLAALAEQKKLTVPVLLKGQIVPAREEDPKGVVVFRQDDRTVALGTLGLWDVAPRLFGLSNPRQLLKGDVTLQGWYRAGLAPSVEVYEVRVGKTFRKSMTRTMRWACAVLIFIVALIIYLSLD